MDASSVTLLLAHGSRVAAANQEILHLAKNLTLALQRPVEAAFLELQSPDLATVIDCTVEAGAKHLQIFPYFLTQGRHVTQDIPKIIQEKIVQYPKVKIVLLDYFGKNPGLIKLLESLLQL